MLDLKLIRDNPEAFDQALAKRGLEPLSPAILALDAERRQTVTALQEAQSRRNQISKDVGKAKAAKREDEAQKLMTEVAALKDAIAAGEAREKEVWPSSTSCSPGSAEPARRGRARRRRGSQ